MATGDNQARRAVIQRLESLQRAGVGQLPRAAPRPCPAAADESQAPEPHRAGGAPREQSLLGTADTERIGRTERAPDDTLEKVRAEVAACTRCRELACTRTQTVFGVGNPRARLCFLGEAPGADEDRQGEPFVGRAGQLLNRILKACGLSRQDVYILNVLKCRPPGNRNPIPEEAANCRPFLDRQLALIAPEFICCLGAVAAQNLLSTTAPIGRMRGKFYDYQGIRVMCTYHPAYLLRNDSARKPVWEDMQMLMREMGLMPQ